jgi:REP element-mobilizing transposase RayT
LDRQLRERTHAYLAGICRNQRAPSLRVGGVEDHVHIGCRLPNVGTVADLIKELKRESSQWLKKQTTALRDFSWQSGYGAFSVSPSHVDRLIRYIENQEQRHRRESFQDEFRQICDKYCVAIDERYVWD